MSVSQVIFLVASGLGVALALGTVLARNLVHAALYLVGFFFVVACQYVLLGVEFLAAMQVLVYVGAVSILILFGIMLTRNIQGDEATTTTWRVRLPAMTVSGLLLGVLVLGVMRFGEPGTTGDGPAANADVEAELRRMPIDIGRALVGPYVVPFEAAGLLLTAALVGAIALARQDDPMPTATGSLDGSESLPVAASAPVGEGGSRG